MFGALADGLLHRHIEIVFEKQGAVGGERIAQACDPRSLRIAATDQGVAKMGELGAVGLEEGGGDERLQAGAALGARAQVFHDVGGTHAATFGFAMRIARTGRRECHL